MIADAASSVRCSQCGRVCMNASGLARYQQTMHEAPVARARLGRSQKTERVRAGSLRRHDRLVMPTGALFELIDVVPVGGDVRLRSETLGSEGGAGRWFTVLVSTMFVRVKEDRRIDTRPDLKERS